MRRGAHDSPRGVIVRVSAPPRYPPATPFATLPADRTRPSLAFQKGARRPMDILPVIRSQYHAALDMLGAAIEACPETVWDRPEDANRSWHVAYHVIFYTQLYLQRTEDDFLPWEKSRPNLQFFGRLPWPPHDVVEVGAPLSKPDIQDYLDLCRAQVDALVPALDLEAPSGFDWLPMSKLELQLYNIRHVMQHAGELYERLAKTTDVELPWVGMVAPARNA